MKLIDKSAVVVEIERIEYETNYEPFTDEVFGKRKVCKHIKDFLSTLEVKEMDLEKKVYAILHNSYEFDDISYGELTPSFMSLDKEIIIEEFNRIKKSEITSFENKIKHWEKYLNEHPKRKEDFQITINKNDELEIYFDNWCYQWKICEYELH